MTEIPDETRRALNKIERLSLEARGIETASIDPWEFNIPDPDEMAEIRHQLGLSQLEVAERVGYDSNTPIANLERGGSVSLKGLLKTLAFYRREWDDEREDRIYAR